MSKQLITNYPRKNTDWKYINYLEDKIKILEEELRIEKKLKSKFKQDYNYLKHQTIPQLENKLHYYNNRFYSDCFFLVNFRLFIPLF